MDEMYRDCRIVAERAAREAGSLLLALYGKVEVREKQPGDLVTEADTASQRGIAASLAASFPDHTLMAEEEGVVPDPANPWRWVVDPLDGTMNFAHGFPFWCVSIGLEHRGEMVVGVIHDPLAGRTFSAAKGQGAEVDGRPMGVSSASSLKQSLISAGMPNNFGADAGRQLAMMGRLSIGTHSIRRTGSTALNLAYLAAGAFDVYYSTSIFPWDVAAGVALVREAGGVVTSIDGGPYDLYSREILATNGKVHAEVVAALREAWPVQ